MAKGKQNEPVVMPVSKLRRDGGCQPRAGKDQNVVEDYAEQMKAGTEFPAVIAFHDGTDHWLADGYHRCDAAEWCGGPDATIAVDVRQGTQRDAVLYSVGANASHGLRRTNADKQRAVTVMLNDPEWVTWANTEIARHCSVSEAMVRLTRPSIEAATAARLPGTAPPPQADQTRKFTDGKGNTRTTTVAGARPAISPIVQAQIDNGDFPGITPIEMEALGKIKDHNKQIEVMLAVKMGAGSVQLALAQIDKPKGSTNTIVAQPEPVLPDAPKQPDAASDARATDRRVDACIAAISEALQRAQIAAKAALGKMPNDAERQVVIDSLEDHERLVLEL